MFFFQCYWVYVFLQEVHECKFDNQLTKYEHVVFQYPIFLSHVIYINLAWWQCRFAPRVLRPTWEPAVCKTEVVAMVVAMAVKVGKEALVAFMEILTLSIHVIY